MRNSFNTLAQLMGSRCGRLSQHTEHTSIHSADTPGTSQPLTANRIPRTSDGRPIISEPVAETSTEDFGSRGRTSVFASVQQSSSHDTHSANWSMRKPSEMPLSCHPSSQQSWLEVQPLTTHIVKIGSHLVQGVSHAGKQPSSSATTKRLREPPRSRSLLSTSGPEPITQATPSTQTSKMKHHSKPTTPAKQIPTSTNLFGKHIAPLRPHTHDATLCRAGPPPQPVSASTRIQHTAATHIHTHSYLSVPSALQTLWARRRSSYVILADSPLQLKVFSELNVELDEVMSLYTPSKMM